MSTTLRPQLKKLGIKGLSVRWRNGDIAQPGGEPEPLPFPAWVSGLKHRISEPSRGRVTCVLLVPGQIPWVCFQARDFETLRRTFRTYSYLSV